MRREELRGREWSQNTMVFDRLFSVLAARMTSGLSMIYYLRLQWVRNFKVTELIVGCNTRMCISYDSIATVFFFAVWVKRLAWAAEVSRSILIEVCQVDSVGVNSQCRITAQL